MFEILLTETFAREFKTLEATLRERIKKKLETTGQNPSQYFERLSGQELFKLRIGKYRIIAQINTIQKKVTLLSIGHRKNIYDKL
ncbi:MAG: type II toxin-antitoxin system RelE/ParE family toxin [archaeon]